MVLTLFSGCVRCPVGGDLGDGECAVKNHTPLLPGTLVAVWHWVGWSGGRTATVIIVVIVIVI